MNQEEKYIARVLLKNRIYQSDKQSFEDLVVSILQFQSTTFTPVKPQGKYGDRKNDGFDSATNTYYQIYGPEDLPKREQDAVDKLNADFSGLKDYWSKSGFTIENFNFVVNDKYKGAYPELLKAIQSLKSSNPEISIDLKRAYHIEDIFISLNDDSIIQIVGSIPSLYNISDVDYSILTEVVNHILDFDLPDSEEEIPLNPDFEKKIEFNKISNQTADILRFAFQQTYVVSDFFNTNSKFAKDELRDKFEGLYERAKYIFKDSETISDNIFYYIRNESSPVKKLSYYNAVYVLMAHYFEYCDIYEPVR